MSTPRVSLDAFEPMDHVLADLFAEHWDRRRTLPPDVRLPAVMRVIRLALHERWTGPMAEAVVGRQSRSVAPSSRSLMARVRSALSVRHVIGRVARAHSLETDDLIGQSKISPIARARGEACWVLRNAVQLSFPIVGMALGGRDHSTVIYACRKVDARIKLDPELRQRLLGFADAPEARAA